jgi:hypothetical protein
LRNVGLRVIFDVRHARRKVRSTPTTINGAEVSLRVRSDRPVMSGSSVDDRSPLKADMISLRAQVGARMLQEGALRAAHPAKRLTFPADRIVSIHRVVMSGEG